MSNDRFSLRSAIGRARGLGSSHSGTHHWLMQRLTAVVLLPLAPWFIYALITTLHDGSLESVHHFFASPFNTIASLILLLAVVYHAVLGAQVIIEDYFHCSALQIAFIYTKKLIGLVAAIIGALAIIKLHLSGIHS